MHFKRLQVRNTDQLLFEVLGRVFKSLKVDIDGKIELLRELVIKHNADWHKVSKDIETLTPRQCYEQSEILRKTLMQDEKGDPEFLTVMCKVNKKNFYESED